MTFDAEALSRCVSCGLCLPACPTFQVTHAEQHGPRGRITGMRMLQAGAIDARDPAWAESMETCVQCRACEPACPSGVQFGSLMERARELMHEQPTRAAPMVVGAARPPGWITGLLFRTFASRRLLRAATVLLALAQLLRLDRVVPAHWRVARRVRLRDAFRRVRPSAGKRRAFLFRGCVMDAWFRPVHDASVRVLAAAGYGVATEPAPACCGALHLHAGRTRQAKRLARDVVAAYAATDGVVIVNSAGCGAAMREYGRLLGTPESAAFAARVRDFAEAVVQGDLPPLRPVPHTVMLQNACHLRNVMRVDAASAQLLRHVPSLRVRRPDDNDLCCGAGGAYSVFQAGFARRMRDRKTEALVQPEVSAVVSGNPGCILHLSAAGVPMLHIAELVAGALPSARPSSEGAEPSRST